MKKYIKGLKGNIITFISVMIIFALSLSVGQASASADNTKFSGASVLAFPGAEGGGAYTSGGRGGDVYIVTNLEDYDQNEEPIEGSLRYGILTTPEEGRTIVFNVSGTIELKRSLRFDNIKNLTIAGQTALGNGITIAGWDTNISNSENIIIRYVAFRPGATNIYNGSDSLDALWGRDNNYFIIDHCSFSWSNDEALSLYRGENGTIQWCIISESLTLSGHSKGRHGYGGISGGDKVTFHHNVYANHTSRNPRLGGGYGGAADANHIAVVQFSNNIIYNWGFNTCYGGGYTFTNFMNNIGIAGPGTRDSVVNRVIDAGESGKRGGFYISGNVINGKTTALLDASSEYVKNSGDVEGDNVTVYANEPYSSVDSTGVNSGIINKGFDKYLHDGIVQADEGLLIAILNHAGASYPCRDAIDARIVAEVKNGLGRYINNEDEVGGYISEFGIIETEHGPSYDTNKNGIADNWEKENGIWGNEDAYKTITDSGYTWLELYINSLVDKKYVAENPVATIETPTNNAQYILGQVIPIEINAFSEYGHNIEKVAMYNGSIYLGDAELDNNGKYVYSIEGLEGGSYYISARVTDSSGNSTQATPVIIHVNIKNKALSEAGWTSGDIGNPDISGSASMVNDIITVKGNGKLGAGEGAISKSKESDPTTDDFHFVYKEMIGDVELTAKLEDIGSVDNHAFTGLMIRENLTDESATAALGLSWVKLSNSYCWSIYLAGRDVNGGNFDSLTEALDSVSSAEKLGIRLLPDIPFKINEEPQGYWLKLGRRGDTFYAYGSIDGEEWILIGERTIAMDDTVYVGFAVDSNDVANSIEQLNFAKFSNLELNNNFTPIQENEDDIGAGPIEKVELIGIDPGDNLSIKKENSVIVLEQMATEGQITQSTKNLASNLSYYVFPAISKTRTMEMDITILDTTTKSNNMGLFVGAFKIGDGEELYCSLGFRNGTSQNLTGYWSKLGKEDYAAGNGSSTPNNGSSNTKPSYVLGEKYHVIFKKTDSGYAVHYIGIDENGDPIDATKIFKPTEAVLSSQEHLNDKVYLGFALIGVTAKVENLILMDEYDRIMYAQGDETDDSGQIVYVVQKGDCLWALAERFYDNGNYYMIIYEANKKTIKNPSIINTGQKLIIPQQ